MLNQGGLNQGGFDQGGYRKACTHMPRVSDPGNSGPELGRLLDITGHCVRVVLRDCALRPWLVWGYSGLRRFERRLCGGWRDCRRDSRV